jgi:tripartite-type tricarboxylate transporter receptor subunit TctC
VVENRAGASGNLATLDVARATPDGYTLLLTISGFQTTNPALFQSLQWDPVRDFAAVAMISRASQVLVVNNNFPTNTLADLIAYGRANPGKLTYGSPGVGTQNSIASEQLAQMTDIKVTAVPYRATAAAFNDLLGGTLGFFVNTTQQLIGPLQGHAVRGLAILSPTRHPLLPDVPTTAEAGLPDLQIDTWYALYAPAGTPKDIVERLSGAIKKIVERPDFKRRVEQSGATISYMGPDELAQYTKEEVAHWTGVIRKLGIPMQTQ